MSLSDPHKDGEVYRYGAPLEEADGVVILLHGRGASARDILGLAPAIDLDSSEDKRLTFLAPQAGGWEWYPQSFLAPREENEPGLTSALKKVESIVELALAAGVPREKIVIGGFSQGACLTSEFAATHPARWAGLIAFTGGLIGPLGSDVSHTGELAGTPTLLLSGDPDPHVPWSRVEETAAVLTSMGAVVTLRRYPGKPHSVNEEEIELARALVEKAFA
jgi:phospholipase/carboxylesterase